MVRVRATAEVTQVSIVADTHAKLCLSMAMCSTHAIHSTSGHEKPMLVSVGAAIPAHPNAHHPRTLRIEPPHNAHLLQAVTIKEVGSFTVRGTVRKVNEDRWDAKASHQSAAVRGCLKAAR